MSEHGKREFRRKYPKLAEELKRGREVKIQAVRSDVKEAEKTAYNVEGYEPTALDFIRRCETDEQALEIINFLEKKGEIEPGYAKQLRSQLAKHGLKSFGKRRGLGCYDHGEMGGR